MRGLLRHFSTADTLSWTSLAALLAAVFFLPEADWVFLLSGLFLAIGVSSAVRHADTVAARVGPSLGTLILALAVTVIEVALILSLMANHSENSMSVARDTVFAAIMIVTNGIIGVCILLGGLRQKELGFQSIGTTALLGVLAVLSCLTLILPNFTTSTMGPTYGSPQLIFVSIAAIALYGALIWAQTKTHRSYFEPTLRSEREELLDMSHPVPSQPRAWLSFIGLVISLSAVIGFAKFLSPVIEESVTALGAPGTVVGIVVALLVLAPETLAAIRAARHNQLQTSLNLALGSGAASIALTIPCVSIFSIMTGEPLALGLDNKGIVFLAMTFIAACFTFGTGRTTALHGIVHLVVLASYMAMSFMP